MDKLLLLFLNVFIFYIFSQTAGDVKAAVQTLRSLLLFYPKDKDSLDNLQFYFETLEGDKASQETQAAQVQ